jgi:hypothetical protein
VNKKHKKRKEKRSQQHVENGPEINPIVLGDKKGAQIKETENPNDSARKAKADKKPSWPSRFGEWARRNSSLAIVSLTVVLVAIAALQALIYNAQLDVIRKDQRPWIRVWIGPGDNKPPIATVIPHLVNSGKTPAKCVVVNFFVEKVDNGSIPKLNAPLETAKFHVTTGALFPNIPYDGHSEDIYALNPIEFSSFEQGTTFLVMYGTASYMDFFGTKHWTKFCGFAKSPGTTMNPAAERCTGYNDIDTN